MAPTNLSKVSVENFKRIFDDFDYILSDIDGTICLFEPLPGVPDFFNHMERLGKSYYFVTNNSALNDDEFNRKFKKCGFDNVEDKVVYPSLCVAQYLKEINFNKSLFCIAADELIHVLKSAGITCVRGPQLSPRRFFDYVKFFQDDPAIGGVFIDQDMRVNMAMAYMATTYLHRPDVLFITGALDKCAPLRKKPVFLPSVITQAIIEDCGRKPLVMAKPSKVFADCLNKRFGITNPKKVLFIGDSLESDVGIGKSAGYKTLFLLTSHKYEEMMREKVNVPDYYANDLGELIPLLEQI